MMNAFRKAVGHIVVTAGAVALVAGLVSAFAPAAIAGISSTAGGKVGAIKAMAEYVHLNPTPLIAGGGAALLAGWGIQPSDKPAPAKA